MRNFLASPAFRAVLVVTSFSVVAAFGAEEPDWWEGIKNPVQATDNFAVVNVGQLKHVGVTARQHLDQYLGLVEGDWDNAYGGNNPFPFTTLPDANNWSIANIGQLKFLALGFYRVLAIHAPAYDVEARLQAMGVAPSQMSVVTGATVPWAENIPTSENYAPVLIGQLKIAFSFDLAAALAQSPDFDGDGISNAYELLYELNPFNKIDAALDYDGDGNTNLEEFLLGTNPTHPDAPQVGFQLFSPTK